MYRRTLRAGARAMLDALVAAYPAGLTREELAEAAGITASGGTFTTYLGHLRRNGLVEVDGPQVSASPTLFLRAEGRTL
jgi:DNA-binding IclR family transcriptional regulator